MNNDEFDTLESKIGAARGEDKDTLTETQKRDAENMSVGMQAGTELTGAIIGGGFIGWALDRWLHTAPWLLIVMLIFGIFTGFFNVYRVTQNSGKGAGFSGLHRPTKTAKNAPDDKEST